MINNIKNNTISEADTKKKINELSEIKKVETKGKRLSNSQKTLLSLFNDLETTTNNNNNDNDNNNNNNSNNNSNESNSKNMNENDSKNESKNESKYESEYESENEKDEYYYEIRQLNNWFETIDQTKPLEEQLKLLKEREEFLSEYWRLEYYHDNKELNYKIFKAKAAYVLNEPDEQLFEKIFGGKFATLVDKLINTTSKEKNQMFVNDIKKDEDKIFEQDEFDKFIIQSSHKCGDLSDAIKVILQFNETIQSDLT